MMKKITGILILVFLLAYAVSASANAGGYCESGEGKNWDMPDTFTGSAPDDVIAIAEMQLGKTRLELGYYADWCAAFVTDVFKLAGQENAAPFISGRTHGCGGLHDEVIKRGGQPVSSSEKKKGDLLFYHCLVCDTYPHVAICYDDGNKRIEGNAGGKCCINPKTLLISHSKTITDASGQETTIIHTEASGQIVAEYIRPNYNNARAKLLHPFIYNDSFYAAVNPDLSSTSKLNRIQHWFNNGIQEGRCASPVFYVEYYKAANSDLRSGFGNDNEAYVNHYISYGISEGRQASVFLNPDTYRASHPDLQAAFGSDNEKLIRHFIQSGISEYRNNSSANFSLNLYRDNYLDLQEAFGTSPGDAIEYIAHYFRSGSAEGRIADHRLQLFFDANGGTVAPTSKVITFSDVYGELPVPLREGYSFTGWFTAVSGGEQVTESTKHTSHTDSTVYAHWQLVGKFGKADLILPKSTVTIKASAFENNKAITSVDAHNCTTIENYAFAGCANLKKIRLPKNCTIGANAFQGTKLTVIYGPSGGTTESWANEHNIQFVAEKP